MIMSLCISLCFFSVLFCSYFFFFNDTATTEIYTLSLHDALPIFPWRPHWSPCCHGAAGVRPRRDRKSTRLNSSHITISYAVFCLKKKKKIIQMHTKNKKKKKKKEKKKEKKKK